jgi:phage tail-like protein
VLSYPDSAWSTRLAAHGTGAGEWDCLLDADAGRYLWLRLDLTGTGAQTASLDAVEIEYPRISLRRYLPAIYGADPDSASFTDRFLAMFDRSLRDVELLVDGLPADLDAEATPYLDWLSDWVGLATDTRLPDAVRRRLLASSARLYDLRGTLAGLRELLLIVLGLDVLEPCAGCGREPGSCSPARACCPPRPPEVSSWTPPPLVLEHFRLRRWLRLGASRIGDDAMVWGRRIVNRSQLGDGAQVGGTQLKTSQDPLRDPFHAYAHKYTVFLPASAGLREQQRKVVQRLLQFATPAHTAGTVEYVEPRFRIGVQSSLGLDSVVARVPAGLVLGETPLGRATVLTGEASDAGAPRALGATTVLG